MKSVKLFKKLNIFLRNKFFYLITDHLLLIKNFFVLNLKLDKLFIYFSNLLNLNVLLHNNHNSFSDFYGFTLNPTFMSIQHIKIQELAFLSEYFLITALFCLTLFALFSLKPTIDKNYFSIKFKYNNQLIFLLVFTLICYLILVFQQINLSLLTISSFNDSIINDSFAVTAKFLIGFSSLCYLIFITRYVKDQKLSNFEYYIILLTSIFGFFLLCCSNDFITAYLAIELQGLAFYVLAAFKKSSNFSIESGVKYFVIGSLSTALFLFGVTFVYGFSGSLILTDFNDFFIWSFSTSSFFLSFESIAKALENFQVTTSGLGNSSIAKLQVILDSLDLIKIKTYYCGLDFEFLKSILAYSSNYVIELSEIDLCKNIYHKMFYAYCNLDLIHITSQYQLQTYYSISLLNNFLLENNFQNFSIELLYNLQESQLSNNDFVNFQNDLTKANFYADIGLETLKLKDTSLDFLKLSDALILDQYFDSFILYVTDSTIDLNFELENLLELRLYMFSVLNILNINNFFLEFGDVNFTESLLLLDLNFIVFGMIIIFLSLLFKLALAPFHLWSPDVYEGSPSSSTFFFMVISKLGIFVFLLRICYSSFYSFIPYWQFYSIIVATISIFIGAVAGLKQRKLKSLLTYSSINNMGFVLLAFSVGSFEGVQIKFYYLIVYILTSLCLWAIILNIKLKKKMYSEKQNRDLGDLALLQESNSVIAQNLAIILFSMAGLPPMVGFLAKMGVFKALTGVSIYFFSIVNILFSVIATFYYLRIVKIVFFENLLVGSLYSTISSKNVFLINLLSFLLIFLFIAPMFLYLYSYKITLFLNKSFY